MSENDPANLSLYEAFCIRKYKPTLNSREVCTEFAPFLATRNYNYNYIEFYYDCCVPPLHCLLSLLLLRSFILQEENTQSYSLDERDKRNLKPCKRNCQILSNFKWTSDSLLAG